MRKLGAAATGLTLMFLAACPPPGLSGTYEASDGASTMSIEFKGGGKATLSTTQQGSAPESKEATYTVKGDTVTVQTAEGFPLPLIKRGDKLEANMMGQVLSFSKK